jgi:hypothetical protein
VADRPRARTITRSVREETPDRATQHTTTTTRSG